MRLVGANNHPTGSTLTRLKGSLSRTTYSVDELRTIDPVDDRPLLVMVFFETPETTVKESDMTENQDVPFELGSRYF